MRQSKYLISSFLATLFTGLTHANLCFAQETKKMASFSTLIDFQNGNVEDSVIVEIVPVENSFTPNFCKPYPKGEDYYYSRLATKVAIMSDDKDILLNINQLRILNGFVKLDATKKYNWFLSRKMRPDPYNGSGLAAGFGLLGAVVDEIQTEVDTRESVTYLFIKDKLRIHILSEATLEKLFRPFPDIHIAYTTDPTRADTETMITYLEILEELEEEYSK